MQVEKENIIVLTSAFCEISETFIYHQVKILQENYNVYLFAPKFINEDLFKLDNVTKITISNTPIHTIDRITSFIDRNLSNSPYFFPSSTNKFLLNFIKENKITKIHAHYGVNGVKILPVVKKSAIELIVSFHGIDASRLLNDKDYTKHLPALFSYASKVILCTKTMLPRLIPQGLIVNKSVVINYGVDIKKIEALIPVIKNSKRIEIMHAGRLTEKKGVPDLTNTIIALKNENPNLPIHFTIIGDGDEKIKIEKIIADNNASSFIHLLGSKPHVELLQHLKSADIFVLNSRIDSKGDSEGFPNAVLEAMACKVPVIASNHAGIPEVVFNEVTGLLIPEKDNTALKKAILRLINSPKQRQEYAENAYQQIVSTLSMQQMETKLLQTFKN